MPVGEHVIHDYRSLGFSLKAHPVAFLRAPLERSGVTPNARLIAVPNGRRVTVAGLVLVRQRPGSAKGVIFMTLEDEDAIANVIVWPKTFELFRPIVLGARLVRIRGRLQSESGVIHVVAERVEDLTPWLGALSEEAQSTRADRLPREAPYLAKTHEELAQTAHQVMPKGRNFQ